MHSLIHNYWNWQRVVCSSESTHARTPTHAYTLHPLGVAAERWLWPLIHLRQTPSEAARAPHPPVSVHSADAEVPSQSGACPCPKNKKIKQDSNDNLKNSRRGVSCPSEVRRCPHGYSTTQSFCHTASSGRSAQSKAPPFNIHRSVLDVAAWHYIRLPGHETMVRVILPRSSFRKRTSAVWVIPHVLFPFTSSKMSPHLHRRFQKVGCVEKNRIQNVYNPVLCTCRGA